MDDSGRMCKLNNSALYGQEFIFKAWGNDDIIMDDGTIFKRTVAYVECVKTGQVEKIPPDQVVFLK